MLRKLFAGVLSYCAPPHAPRVLMLAATNFQLGAFNADGSFGSHPVTVATGPMAVTVGPDGWPLVANVSGLLGTGNTSSYGYTGLALTAGPAVYFLQASVLAPRAFRLVSWSAASPSAVVVIATLDPAAFGTPASSVTGVQMAASNTTVFLASYSATNASQATPYHCTRPLLFSPPPSH